MTTTNTRVTCLFWQVGWPNAKDALLNAKDALLNRSQDFPMLLVTFCPQEGCTTSEVWFLTTTRFQLSRMNVLVAVDNSEVCHGYPLLMFSSRLQNIVVCVAATKV